MSTAEGYSIDAYCDTCGAMTQGYGMTRAQAEREIRARGWTIGPGEAPPGAASIAGGRSAKCPAHRSKRARPRPIG